MILACDTSSTICSVAIAHRGVVVFERKIHGGQIHIEKLAPFIDDALSFCKSEDKVLDGLAIAIGPGSFNGLRIGLATMKGLASALSLPLIAIPSTDALAYGAKRNISGLSRAIIYSHRNFVHYADYELHPNKEISTPEFQYETWDNLAGSEFIHYFGTADRGFAEWLNQTDGGMEIKRSFHVVEANAGHVALIAESRQEEQLTGLDELEPFYNAQYEAKKWTPPSFN